MVKRYEFIETYGMVVRVESDDGDYVLASDFDRMRRRLVALRCIERSKRRRVQDKLLSAEGDWQKADIFCRNSLKLRYLSRAIERGEPLEYFRKLGSD